MNRTITGKTLVAGVAGAPVAHSLSPLIHNAWLEAAGIDGVYVAFTPPADGFAAFARGLAGGAIRGLNVTVPFKEVALDIATRASDRATRAGAANLLVFEPGGEIRADNTDGEGLIGALAAQAPGWRPGAGPVVILGAGGAARGAAAALIAAALFSPLYGVLAGGAAFVGHIFPVWLGFRGGKGVATFYGVLFAVAWPVGLAAGATWIAMALVFRISSLAGLTAAVLTPLWFVLLRQASPERLILAVGMAVLIVIRHDANIRRLLRGEEPRIGGSKATA